jgi:hypothetical protein
MRACASVCTYCVCCASVCVLSELLVVALSCADWLNLLSSSP